MRERDAAKSRIESLQKTVDHQQVVLRELEKSVGKLNELRIIEGDAEKAYQRRKQLETLQGKLREAVSVQRSKEEHLGRVETELAQALATAAPRVYTVGDCVASREMPKRALAALKSLPRSVFQHPLDNSQATAPDAFRDAFTALHEANLIGRKI